MRLQRLFVAGGLFAVLVAGFLAFGHDVHSASPAAVAVAPAVPKSDPGYSLASSGGVGGMWLQRGNDPTKPYAAFYSMEGAGQHTNVLGFSKSQKGDAHDFAIVGTGDSVHFQIRDAAGKVHFVPATALLKLDIGPGGKPAVMQGIMPADVVMDGRPVAGREPVAFEEALRDQIETRPETIRSRRVLNVLDMEDGPRRTRILNRMERHAIAHLEIKGEPGKIDWQNIDWQKVFDILLKILSMILPFLLMANADGMPVDMITFLEMWFGWT